MTVVRLVTSSIIFTTIICDTSAHRRRCPFETKEAGIVCPKECAILGSYIIATVTKSMYNKLI